MPFVTTQSMDSTTHQLDSMRQPENSPQQSYPSIEIDNLNQSDHIQYNFDNFMGCDVDFNPISNFPEQPVLCENGMTIYAQQQNQPQAGPPIEVNQQIHQFSPCNSVQANYVPNAFFDHHQQQQQCYQTPFVPQFKNQSQDQPQKSDILNVMSELKDMKHILENEIVTTVKKQKIEYQLPTEINNTIQSLSQSVIELAQQNQAMSIKIDQLLENQATLSKICQFNQRESIDSNENSVHDEEQPLYNSISQQLCPESDKNYDPTSPNPRSEESPIIHTPLIVEKKEGEPEVLIQTVQDQDQTEPEDHTLSQYCSQKSETSKSEVLTTPVFTHVTPEKEEIDVTPNLNIECPKLVNSLKKTRIMCVDSKSFALTSGFSDVEIVCKEIQELSPDTNFDAIVCEKQAGIISSDLIDAMMMSKKKEGVPVYAISPECSSFEQLKQIHDPTVFMNMKKNIVHMKITCITPDIVKLMKFAEIFLNFEYVVFESQTKHDYAKKLKRYLARRNISLRILKTENEDENIDIILAKNYVLDINSECMDPVMLMKYVSYTLFGNI